MKTILLIICMMSLPAFALHLDPNYIYQENNGTGSGTDPDAPHWDGTGEFAGADLGILTEGPYDIFGLGIGGDLDSFLFTIAEGSILESIEFFQFRSPGESRYGDVGWDILSASFDDPLYSDILVNFREGVPYALYSDMDLGAGDYLLNGTVSSWGEYRLTLNLAYDTASVPEPGTMGIMAVGMIGLTALRRRQLRG